MRKVIKFLGFGSIVFSSFYIVSFAQAACTTTGTTVNCTSGIAENNVITFGGVGGVNSINIDANTTATSGALGPLYDIDAAADGDLSVLINSNANMTGPTGIRNGIIDIAQNGGINGNINVSFNDGGNFNTGSFDSSAVVRISQDGNTANSSATIISSSGNFTQSTNNFDPGSRRNNIFHIEQNDSVSDARVEIHGGTYTATDTGTQGAGKTEGQGHVVLIERENSTGTVNFEMTDGVINSRGTTAPGGVGVRLTGSSNTDVVMNLSGGQINVHHTGTAGSISEIAAGVNVQNNRVSTGTGLIAQTGTELINLSGVEINLSGTSGFGVNVHDGANGDKQINMTAGHIIADVADLATGIKTHTQNPGTEAMTDINVSGAQTIIDLTSANVAQGIESTNSAYSDANDINIDVTDNAVVRIDAQDGNGIRIVNIGFGGSHVNVNNAKVLVEGAGNGISILDDNHRGEGMSVTVDNGVVQAAGEDKDGIRLSSRESGVNFGDTIYDVNIHSGSTITGGSGNGAAIRVSSKAGGSIDIAAGAVVDGSASGLAIVDGDEQRDFNGIDGIDETRGNVVINTQGNVTGDAILGLGDDVFNQTGGTFGVVYGDDVGQTANDGDDTFNLTGGISGGFIGGAGSDIASIDSVPVSAAMIFDGGDDATSNDGWIDTISLNEVMGQLDGSRFVNWESISFSNHNVEITDLVVDDTINAGPLNVCNGSTTISGASNINSVLGCISSDTINVSSSSFIDTIDAAGGDDIIAVTGNAAANVIFADGNGQDSSSGTPGNDQILVNTSGAVNLVDAGAGDDIFEWQNGNVSEFQGREGSDTATVSSAQYDGTQILDGGDDVSYADGQIDTLILENVNAPNAAGARILNFEDIIVNGGFVQINDAMLTTENITLTNSARLDALDRFVLNGSLVTENGGTLEISGAGAGVYEVTGNVTNNGIINMQDGATGDRLTIGGNYTGSGQLNSDINTDNNASDRMFVNGDASGSTLIGLRNVGSEVGMATGKGPGNGIPLVSVAGTTDDAAFSIVNDELIVGAYRYTLNLETDNTFYLQSELLPQPKVMEKMNKTLMNSISTIPSSPMRHANHFRVGNPMSVMDRKLGTLRQRIGDCHNTVEDDEQVAENQFNCQRHYAWIKVQGSHLDMNPDSSSQAAFEENARYMQFGFDKELSVNRRKNAQNSSRWLLGLNAHIGDSDVNVEQTDNSIAGAVNKEFQGLGLSATHYAGNGVYTDFILQLSDIDAAIVTGRGQSDVKGDNLSLSSEIGKTFIPNKENQLVSLTPQMQLTFSRSDIDDYTDSDNVHYSVTDGDTMTARLGLLLQKDADPELVSKGQVKDTSIYAVANLYANVDGDTEIDASGTRLLQEDHDSWLGIGAGGQLELVKDMHLYGQINYRQSLDDFGDSREYTGMIGLRKTFTSKSARDF